LPGELPKAIAAREKKKRLPQRGFQQPSNLGRQYRVIGLPHHVNSSAD
jgi:hypothetical protein